jgi:hypothetical protein
MPFLDGLDRAAPRAPVQVGPVWLPPAASRTAAATLPGQQRQTRTPSLVSAVTTVARSIDGQPVLNSPAGVAKRRNGRLVAVSDGDREAHNACVAFSGRRRDHGSSESALSSVTDERSRLMSDRQLIPVIDGFEPSSGPSEADAEVARANGTSRPVRGRLVRPGGYTRDGRRARRGRRAAKGRDAGWLPTPSVRSAVRPASRPDSGRFDPFDQ